MLIVVISFEFVRNGQTSGLRKSCKLMFSLNNLNPQVVWFDAFWLWCLIRLFGITETLVFTSFITIPKRESLICWIWPKTKVNHELLNSSFNWIFKICRNGIENVTQSANTIHRSSTSVYSVCINGWKLSMKVMLFLLGATVTLSVTNNH